MKLIKKLSLEKESIIKAQKSLNTERNEIKTKQKEVYIN